MINEIDIKSLWQELNIYEKELDKEASTLQDVWVKIADLKKSNEAEAKKLVESAEFNFIDSESVITLNVGGQLFDAPVNVLTRDPYSILAACCRVKKIIQPEVPIKSSTESKIEDTKLEMKLESKFDQSADDPEVAGVIYFDRDWWLFRHILAFLRSNVLPNELETLKELYTEASFYRLEGLQRAIEEIPVDQISTFNGHIMNTAGPSAMESMKGTNLIRRPDILGASTSRR